MKRLALLVLLWATPALAQHINPVINDVWTYYGPTLGGMWGPASGGGGGTPGGVSGDIQYNNAGSFGGLTPGTGVATFLATPSSANLAAAITGETGTGALVFGTSPTISGLTLSDVASGTQCLHVNAGGLVTGTGSDCATGGSGTINAGTAGQLASYSGTTTISPITTGTGVVTALGINTGSAGAFVVNGGALGTPSGGTLTNATGLPVSTGISGLAAGVATFLATPSSANLRAALTDESGTGVAYFQGGNIGTPSAGVATNLTGLPLTTGVTGILPSANGGAGGLTGLVLGNGASAPTAYGGTTCTNQAATALNASGAATCASITNAFLTAGSFTSITGVGTLTVGTWNATTIGLAKGGTNADLSASGGTSQVLRQSSAGAAVTVSQLAFTDISGTSSAAQQPAIDKAARTTVMLSSFGAL